MNKFCYIVRDEKGNPVTGTKICATHTGALNSMNPCIWELIFEGCGNHTNPLNTIYYTSTGGYGKPKELNPRLVVDNIQKIGNPNNVVAMQDVLDYNKLVRECLTKFTVEVIEIK